MFDACFEGLEARLFLSAASDDALVKQSIHSETRDIFGRDNRTRVTKTTQHPYAAVGQVDSWWDDGSGLSCTGAVIGRYHVLTAAHCVYETSDGEAESVEFTAARNGGYFPFGTVGASNVRIDRNYPGAESSADDYALVTLSEPLGDETGWFGFGNYKTSAFSRMRVNSAGYPGDLSSGAVMYRQSGRLAAAQSSKLMGKIDVAQGQSGSPIYRDDNTIVGVLSSSNWQYTYASRITGKRFAKLETWMEKDERRIAAKSIARQAKRARALAAEARATLFSTTSIAEQKRALTRAWLWDAADREQDSPF